MRSLAPELDIPRPAFVDIPETAKRAVLPVMDDDAVELGRHREVVLREQLPQVRQEVEMRDFALSALGHSLPTPVCVRAFYHCVLFLGGRNCFHARKFMLDEIGGG